MRPAAGAAAAGPAESPGFLLWHATLRWQRLVGEALRPLELTHVQFVLLASLWWLGEARGERPTQAALAAFAATDPMMTSQVVRALERRRLVERASDPADARALRLRATAAGGRLARRAMAVVEDADRRFFAAAGGGERLAEALRALAEPPALASAPARRGRADRGSAPPAAAGGPRVARQREPRARRAGD